MAKIASTDSSLKTRLGSDLKFPINTTFQAISGQSLLLQDIQILLLTIPGERPFRPDFGCHLRNQIWENMEAAKSDGIASIRTAIDSFEPRINVITVTGDINYNTGLITFNIQFVIKANDTVLNLVFPFRAGSQLSQS